MWAYKCTSKLYLYTPKGCFWLGQERNGEWNKKIDGKASGIVHGGQNKCPFGIDVLAIQYHRQHSCKHHHLWGGKEGGQNGCPGRRSRLHSLHFSTEMTQNEGEKWTKIITYKPNTFFSLKNNFLLYLKGPAKLHDVSSVNINLFHSASF